MYYKKTVLETLERIDKSLIRLENLLTNILNGENHMSEIVDLLLEKVTAESGAVQSLLTLFAEFVALVKASIGDPAKLIQIVGEVEARTTDIQAAIDANPLP